MGKKGRRRPLSWTTVPEGGIGRRGFVYEVLVGEFGVNLGCELY